MHADSFLWAARWLLACCFVMGCWIYNRVFEFVVCGFFKWFVVFPYPPVLTSEVNST
jgi:hypothetical protein